MASSGAMDPNRPAFAIPDVTYGPFVQVSPGTNGGPVIVTRLQAPTDQPNARNQLVLAPGVGGGPIVKVYDFINGRLASDRMLRFSSMHSRTIRPWRIRERV